MIVIALMLAAPSPAQTGGGTAYRQAYEESFRRSFRPRSIEECRASAKTSGAGNLDVTHVCTCVTDRLLATKTVEQLSERPSAAILRPLVTACMKAGPPKR